MERHDALLKILADGRFHSGEELGAVLGVSRTAVWKRLRALESLGLELQAVAGRGYRLARPLELLQEEQILAWLGAEAREVLRRLDIHTNIDSTNRYLVQQSAKEEAHGTVCLAERQQAGRGRRGRQWMSPFAANIYLSYLWRFEGGPAALSGASLAVGVLVARALRDAGITGVGLKWPNDLVWSDKKLAGVLLEMAGEAAGPCNVVIGIGLNVNMPATAAEDIEQPWTDVQQIAEHEVSRNELVGRVLQHLLPGLRRYQAEGLAHFMDEWQELDAMAGREVRMLLSGNECSGIALGIDESGAIRVQCEDGVRLFHSGEVSLRPVKPEGE